MISVAQIGSLACQKNPYLQKLIAQVVSCEAANVVDPTRSNKSKNRKSEEKAESVYHVILSDSILFPEGGGQPCDYGEICLLSESQEKEHHHNSDFTKGSLPPIKILNVQRHGDHCVVYTPVPFSVGSTILMEVDWERRYDHMQHHTAQHLLSAIIARKDVLHLQTESWSLSWPYCYIQLDIKDYLEEKTNENKSLYSQYINQKEKRISDEMMKKIQGICNDAIAASVPVRCQAFESRAAYIKSLEEKEEQGLPLFRSRGIPKDVTGAIRVVSIDALDESTCCGTHVRSLAELHGIQLLFQEIKGTILRIFFISGRRIFSMFSDLFLKEQKIVQSLDGARPTDFLAVIQKRRQESLEMQKKIKTWTSELAHWEAQRILLEEIPLRFKNNFNNTDDTFFICCVRRDDVEPLFFQVLRESLGHHSFAHRLILVTAWANNQKNHTSKDVEGQILISVPAINNSNAEDNKNLLQQVVAKANDLLSGTLKGGFTKGAFRGKACLNNWARMAKEMKQWECGS